MDTELVVALLSSPAVVAAVGAWTASRKARRSSEADHKIMAAKVDALAEDIGEVKADVHEMRAEQNRHGQRLATIEGRFADHLLERNGRTRRG